jgi:hypothetical protein
MKFWLGCCDGFGSDSHLHKAVARSELPAPGNKSLQPVSVAMHRSTLAIVGGLTLATGAAQAWKDQCESFVPNNLPEVTLVKSTYYETGQAINFTGLYTSLATIADRPFCRRWQRGG